MYISDCPTCGHLDSQHPLTHVDSGHINACVDVGIAPLIEALGKAGLSTHMSCQGQGGDGGWDRPWLVFEGDEGVRFVRLALDLARDARHKQLADRIGDYHSGDTEMMLRKGIDLSTPLSDAYPWLFHGFLRPLTKSSQYPALMLAIHLPKPDMDWLTQRLNDARAKSGK